MKTFFTYDIKYWNDVDEREEVVCGITDAEDNLFSSAVKEIEKYYGNDLLEIMSIKYLDEVSCLEVPNTALNEIEKKYI